MIWTIDSRKTGRTAYLATSGHVVRVVFWRFFLVSFLFTLTNHAQQTKDLEGQVFSIDGDVAGTHVMNISTQRATITDVNGFFSIPIRFNDTLVFSAVQYKRKVVPVQLAIYESGFLNVYMEAGEIKLEEVTVMPYNLSGRLAKDVVGLSIDPLVTANTLGLPNADVRFPTQAERSLYAARTWDAHFYIIAAGTNLDPLINYFSGRTKRLNQRIAREAAYEQIQKVRGFYVDSLFVQGLRIPKERITDFINFCEVDTEFKSLLKAKDKLGLWEFMLKKGARYREGNNLE